MLPTVDSTNTQWSNMLSTVDMLSTVESTNTQWPNRLSTVDSAYLHTMAQYAIYGIVLLYRTLYIYGQHAIYMV